MPLQPLSDVEIIPVCTGSLHTAYRLNIPCGKRSSLTVTISLDNGSRMLYYDVECDWREFGSTEDGVPNLRYFLPMGYYCEAYRSHGDALLTAVIRSETGNKRVLRFVEVNGQTAETLVTLPRAAEAARDKKAA